MLFHYIPNRIIYPGGEFVPGTDPWHIMRSCGPKRHDRLEDPLKGTPVLHEPGYFISEGRVLSDRLRREGPEYRLSGIFVKALMTYWHLSDMCPGKDRKERIGGLPVPGKGAGINDVKPNPLGVEMPTQKRALPPSSLRELIIVLPSEGGLAMSNKIEQAHFLTDYPYTTWIKISQ